MYCTTSKPSHHRIRICPARVAMRASGKAILDEHPNPESQAVYTDQNTLVFHSHRVT